MHHIHGLSWVPTIHSFRMVLKFLEFLKFSHKSMELIPSSFCGIELLIMHAICFMNFSFHSLTHHPKSCWLFSFWLLGVCISLLEILSFTNHKKGMCYNIESEDNHVKVNWPLEEKQICLQISQFAWSSISSIFWQLTYTSFYLFCLLHWLELSQNTKSSMFVGHGPHALSRVYNG
mgnify:CR=1 FL=1